MTLFLLCQLISKTYCEMRQINLIVSPKVLEALHRLKETDILFCLVFNTGKGEFSQLIWSEQMALVFQTIVSAFWVFLIIIKES